jgi:hypothetical protein
MLSMANVTNAGTEQEFKEALTECAKIAVKIGEFEQEHTKLHDSCVKWQKTVFYPVFAVVIVAFGIISFVTGNTVLISLGVFLGFVSFAAIQFVRPDNKRLSKMDLEMSKMVKNEWRPRKKHVDDLAKTHGTYNYAQEYANVAEIHSHLNNLTVARRTVAVGKSLLPTPGQVAIICVGMFALAGVVLVAATGMINAAGADFGRGSAYKTIKRIEDPNGKITYEEE